MRKLDGNEDENLFSRDGSKQTLFSNKTCGNPELNPQLFQLKAVKNGNCPPSSSGAENHCKKAQISTKLYSSFICIEIIIFFSSFHNFAKLRRLTINFESSYFTPIHGKEWDISGMNEHDLTLM